MTRTRLRQRELKRLYRAESDPLADNHNPRVGGSSPSSGIAAMPIAKRFLVYRRPRTGALIPQGASRGRGGLRRPGPLGVVACQRRVSHTNPLAGLGRSGSVSRRSPSSMARCAKSSAKSRHRKPRRRRGSRARGRLEGRSGTLRPSRLWRRAGVGGSSHRRSPPLAPGTSLSSPVTSAEARHRSRCAARPALGQALPVRRLDRTGGTSQSRSEGRNRRERSPG
jgi:hypothetical protein